MSRFVKVYVDPAKDQDLTNNQVMYMRKEASPFIEVEEGDLHRALGIIGEDQTVYSKGLIVVDGYLDTTPSPGSIGSNLRVVMGELAKEKQAVIKLYNRSGELAKTVRSEGEYHISLYSMPDDPVFRDAHLDTVYINHLVFDDVELRARETGYDLCTYPSVLLREVIEDAGVDYLVMEDDAGNIFALYTPFNAWVILRCGRDEDILNPTDVFPTLFRRLLANMDALVEDRAAFMEEQEEAARQETLTRWGALVAGRHDQSVTICKEELIQANEKMVRLRVDMTETLSDISEREKVLRIAASVRPDEEALALEFTRIYENPWINTIEIDDEGEWMTVFTHTLVMDGDEDIRTAIEMVQKRWEGKLVPIGKFSIRVGSSGRVQIENLTNPKTRNDSTWYHPHIPSSGAPCFGTIERALPKMLAQYEFGSAIHLLTGFLTCCNADDAWGANICLWEEDAYPKPSHARETPSVEAEAAAS